MNWRRSTATIKLDLDNPNKFLNKHTNHPPTMRCVYCGNIANNFDEGDRENDWNHDCTCEGAMKEKEIKNEISSINNTIYHAQNRVRKLESDLEEYTRTRGDNMKYLIARDGIFSLFLSNSIKITLDEVDRFVKKTIMENKLSKDDSSR
jgi:hypothetical protein